MAKRQIQSQESYSGGLNTRDNPISLKPNEAGAIYNVYPGEGSPVPREGTTWFTTSQFGGEVAYTIAFEDDDVSQTIIAFLQDGRVQALQKNSPVVIDIADLGVTAPTHGNLSHVFADKAIFTFSQKQEFNLIIEQDIFTDGTKTTPLHPFFSVRSNFVHNFGQSHPSSGTHKSFWWLEGATTADGVENADQTLVTVANPNSGNSNDIGFNRAAGQSMFIGYAIGYVRRTDAEAFEVDGITPKETIVFNAGAMETNYDPTSNVRITALQKDPLHHINDKANVPPQIVHNGEFTDVLVYDPATHASDIQVVEVGGYVWDRANGLLYRCVTENINAFANLRNSDSFVLEPFFDEANDGVPNLRVLIPNNSEVGSWYGTDAEIAASRAKISDISDTCHPLNNGNYDEQITHIRIYRTLQATSFEAAKGNSYRFLVDLPIDYIHQTGKPYYVDTTSDAELSGSDNILSFWGTTPPPLSKYSHYHNGRIWVGGEVNLPGRFWPSEFPLDATAVRKYLTHFSPDINFIDCNQNTGDFAQGIAETNDQLIFLMKKSIWGLFRGLLEGTGPQKLSATRGCFSLESIVQVDKTVYYLSQEGPALISGREVHLIESFKAGEFWPIQGNRQQKGDMAGKNIFRITPNSLKTLRSWYHEETWFISYSYALDGETKWICIGFFVSDINSARGGWEIRFALPELQKITNIAQWDSSRLAFTVADTQFTYNFLDRDAADDMGVLFVCGAKSRRVYANPERRERFGSLWDLMIFTDYEDSADLEVLVYVDKDSIIANSSYQQALIDNNSRVVASRHNIQFAFPEGVFGQFFEIEWRKVFDKSFELYGFDMRYYLVEGGTPRFTTTDSTILIDVSSDGLGSMNLAGPCQPFIVGPRN